MSLMAQNDSIAAFPSRRIDAHSRVSAEYLAYVNSIAHAGSEPRHRLAACRQLLDFGMIGEAIALLTTLTDVPSVRGEVEDILQRARMQRRAAAAIDAPSVRPDDDAGDNRGYWIVPASSDTTLVVFTGRGKRIGISVYFMQNLFRRQNVNVIYLFDWLDAFYLAGVCGLGADAESTIEHLRRLCSELGSNRLLCIGQSLGGYGALRYGAKLEADGILAFSPIILSAMKPRVRARIEAASGNAVSEESADVFRTVAEARHPPHIEIVYGAENRADTASARHMARLDCVQERPLAGVRDHASIQATLANGTFESIVVAFMAAVGAGSWGERNEAAQAAAPVVTQVASPMPVPGPSGGWAAAIRRLWR